MSQLSEILVPAGGVSVGVVVLVYLANRLDAIDIRFRFRRK